jgi:hypothetical protein
MMQVLLHNYRHEFVTMGCLIVAAGTLKGWPRIQAASSRSIAAPVRAVTATQPSIPAPARGKCDTVRSKGHLA